MDLERRSSASLMRELQRAVFSAGFFDCYYREMSDDALEHLSKKLDGGTTGVGVPRSRLSPHMSSAPKGWKPGVEHTMSKRKPLFKFKPLEALFAGSIAFFIIALGIAGLILFAGNNTVSTKNVDVQVSGPTEISAGNTLSLQVVITNRNAVPMELTDLIVEFPSGTRSDSDISKDLPRIRESLGTIRPGESVNRTIRAVVFGDAGSDLQVKATAEYRVPSSNAVFVSPTTYTAKINQSPASITVEALKEAVSGQEVTFSVSLTSNSPAVLKDVLLLADYPPGFSFESSTPAPISGSGSWNLGDIESGGKRTISFKGVFTGEDGDARIIHFSAGTRKQGQDDAIIAPLAKSELTFTVTKPFISVAVLLDGSASSSHTISRGEQVQGEIRWVNNLPVKVQNVEITLDFKGQILDRTTVQVERGFFSSTNSQIVWTKATDQKLGDVAPGASETLGFTFKTLPVGSGSFKNPEIVVTANIKAERQSEVNVPTVIRASAVTNAFIASDLVLSPSLTHANGPFNNRGPLPPKADTETTYTVTWSVSNSANALANASVSAVLPLYTKFIAGPTGDSSLSYNTSGRILTWNIGDIAASQSKTISFQVGFTPSLTQVGEQPTIIADQRVYGFDRFVRGQIEKTAPPLTSASAGSGIVVP